MNRELALNCSVDLLELRNISVEYDAKIVVRNTDLTIKSGEVVALIGPSGAGKSSLLRCLNLLESPSTGSIVFKGEKIFDAASPSLMSKAQLLHYRQRVGMVFQNFNLFPHLSALHNVMVAQVHALGRTKQEAEVRARTELTRVGLEEKLHARPSKCSGGQQQRIAIARALAMDPELMLFDEVTASLDPELGLEVLRTMRQLASKGMTMVLVTHEIAFAREVADRILFMADGIILENGPPQDILCESKHPRVQRFLDAINRS